MKIGFYGGMANNTYVAASRFAEEGTDVVYVRDWWDKYAVSQPVWEDSRIVLSSELLAETSGWEESRWLNLERDSGFTPPDWVFDPLNDEGVDGSSVYGPKWFESELDSEINWYIERLPPMDQSAKILGALQSCDLLYVSNVHACIMALVSGVPFVICPAGGEFIVATGQEKITSDYHRRVCCVQRRLLLEAFRKARAVVTLTNFWGHVGLANGYVSLISHFWRANFQQISMPYRAVPKSGRNILELRNRLFEELNLELDPTKPLVFVPSRIDYKWKGQDMFWDGVCSSENSRNVNFLFAGWGNDLEQFRNAVKGWENVTFLQGVVSKPILYDLFSASDLVADQFIIGHLGTAAREAMSVGTPVMIKMETLSKYNLTDGCEVFNIHSASAVSSVISKLGSGDWNHSYHEEGAIQWTERNSAPAKVVREVCDLL